ncbi:Radical SAM domain protein [Lachnospiraceae bacterium TWA4]|nr:Radical SAM domain protein [Lachnospiraceae bacterium TWA4]
MKAKLMPRIDIHDRIELKNALPLDTPYVIHIDPSDTCNFHCKFCPSGNTELMKTIKGRGHGSMDFEVYKQIIDDLAEFRDPIRVIRLYKEGEPLVHPKFADMVRYAKQSPHVLRVDTTTNASLLTPERSLEIIDAGLDRINISIEGINANQYKEFSNHTIDYEKFVENIRFFYDHKKQCQMNIKINGDILNSEQEEEFYQVFGNITDGINVEHTIEYWPKFQDMKVEFDETVSLLGGESGEVQVCPYVFYEMCINSDGTYSLCRFDWNHAMLMNQHVGGRVTPKKIWDSIVLFRFQESFLKKERKLLSVLSCPNCGILKQGVPEDLDEFAGEILDRM